MTDSDSEYESETSHAMGSMGRKKKEKRKEQQYRIFKVQISSNSQSVASYYDFEAASECKGANHGGRGNDQSIPLLRIHPNTPFHAKKILFSGKGLCHFPRPLTGGLHSWPRTKPPRSLPFVSSRIPARSATMLPYGRIFKFNVVKAFPRLLMVYQLASKKVSWRNFVLSVNYGRPM